MSDINIEATFGGGRNPELDAANRELDFRLMLGEHGRTMTERAKSIARLAERPAFSDDPRGEYVNNLTYWDVHHTIAWLYERACGNHESRPHKYREVAEANLLPESRQLVAEAHSLEALLSLASQNEGIYTWQDDFVPLPEHQRAFADSAMQRLWASAEQIHQTLLSREGTDGPITAPDGHGLVLKFPRNPIGIGIRLNDGREPEYVRTAIEWWRQSGVYAPLPPQSGVRLTPNGETALIANSLELAAEKQYFRWYGPVFHAYTGDRETRALHGIGHTEVTIEPLERLARTYTENPPQLPESERIHVDTGAAYRARDPRNRF